MPYVRPAPAPSVDEGDALEDLFQAALAGITGLPGDLVRPAWQPEPPNFPDFGTDWAALRVASFPSDLYAFVAMVDEATALLETSETLEVSCMFYGPGAQARAGEWRDGLQVDMNRADLQARDIKLVSVGEQRQVPALLKQAWTKRVDVPSTWRRWVRRRYPINSIAGAGAGLDNELYVTPIVVTPPT